jgi:hypothetical protein
VPGTLGKWHEADHFALAAARLTLPDTGHVLLVVASDSPRHWGGAGSDERRKAIIGDLIQRARRVAQEQAQRR